MRSPRHPCPLQRGRSGPRPSPAAPRGDDVVASQRPAQAQALALAPTPLPGTRTTAQALRSGLERAAPLVMAAAPRPASAVSQAAGTCPRRPPRRGAVVWVAQGQLQAWSDPWLSCLGLHGSMGRWATVPRGTLQPLGLVPALGVALGQGWGPEQCPGQVGTVPVPGGGALGLPAACPVGLRRRRRWKRWWRRRSWMGDLGAKAPMAVAPRMRGLWRRVGRVVGAAVAVLVAVAVRARAVEAGARARAGAGAGADTG